MRPMSPCAFLEKVADGLILRAHEGRFLCADRAGPTLSTLGETPGTVLPRAAQLVASLAPGPRAGPVAPEALGAQAVPRGNALAGSQALRAGGHKLVLVPPDKK